MKLYQICLMAAIAAYANAQGEDAAAEAASEDWKDAADATIGATEGLGSSTPDWMDAADATTGATEGLGEEWKDKDGDAEGHMGKHEWPDCEGQCDKGFYFNPLSCRCFSMAQCKMECPEGEDLCPTERCECRPIDVVRSLFPEWATPEDVARAEDIGIKWAMEYGHKNEKDGDENDETREKADRFADALTDLIDAAEDLFGMDSSTAVSAGAVTVAALATVSF